MKNIKPNDCGFGRSIGLLSFFSFVFALEWRLALLAYCFIAWNLFLVSRKVGNYSFWFSLFYPAPLVFYFWVYFSSIWNFFCNCKCCNCNNCEHQPSWCSYNVTSCNCIRCKLIVHKYICDTS